MNEKYTIIAIPGLGGHESVFKKYADEFPDTSFKTLAVLNPVSAERDIFHLAEESGPSVFLCNCYGAQFALRLSYRRPDLVKAIIVIEPFFAQFSWWRRPARLITDCILWMIAMGNWLGLRRRSFSIVDYEEVEKRHLFFQPFFDMLHQDLTGYFEKIMDILTFTLPTQVDKDMLFIFSPYGFTRNHADRATLGRIFTRLSVVELGARSHNIVTLSRLEIISAVRDWLSERHIS